MPRIQPISTARSREQPPIPLSPLHRRVQELETLADGLLGLLQMCEARLRLMTSDRDRWRQKAQALKGLQP
jgi:hypothetical protein